MQEKASIRDVAAMAGVSVGTVSHVLNHPEKVTPARQEKVRNAIRKLGYIPSEAGRQLRKGRSKFVGIVVLDIFNPFFVDAAKVIEKQLAKDGLYPLLFSDDGDPNKEAEILNLLMGQNVRGLIITPSVSTLKNLELIKHAHIPAVLFDCPPQESEFPTVGTDDVAGSRLAMEHLAELGHCSVGFINGPKSLRQANDRERGVQAVAREKGLDLHTVEVGHFNADSGAEGMDRLLDSCPDLSAVTCANDQIAIGAMRAIRAQGLSIPHDISICGYDNIDIAKELITPLTTVSQPMEQMGKAAVELLRRIAFDEPMPSKDKAFVFTPSLVVRQSTQRFEPKSIE